MNQHLSSPISQPAYARLRECIREDIVSGVWSLGQHITMAELAAFYGVSGNTVREALHQLQGDGLVTMRLNRGAVVTDVDADFIRNVYNLRAAIEGMLAAEAAERATREEVKRISARAADYEAAVASGDITRIVQANRELHKTINTIARNPVALEVFDGRSSLIDALRRILGNRPGRLDEIIAEHRAIVRAIADHDALEAEKLARHHSTQARDHMLENIADRAPQSTGGRNDV